MAAPAPGSPTAADEAAALLLAADIIERLPAVLAGARIRAGLSQEALAWRLKVDRQSVQRWEAGKTFPAHWRLPAVLRFIATARPATGKGGGGRPGRQAG